MLCLHLGRETRKETGVVDDLGDDLFLAIRHHVHPCNSLDLMQLHPTARLGKRESKLEAAKQALPDEPTGPANARPMAGSAKQSSNGKERRRPPPQCYP